MNRFRPDQLASANSRASNITSTILAAHTSTDASSFFLPVHYEPNYNYPVVVWLHSDGRSQTQMTHVVPHMSLQNYVGVGVRAPKAIDSMGHEFQWLESETGIAVAEQSVFAAIDEASDKYSIDSSRIYIAGLREGGSMAFRLGLRYPELFAGAISLGGKFPQGGRPFANLQAARNLPMLLAMGSRSDAYPLDDFCNDLRVLHTAKLGLAVRQYDVADELEPQILREVNEWIMGQVTGMKTLDTADLCDTEPVEFSIN